MTKSWMKFLLKTDIKIRNKLEVIIRKIMLNDFEWLHIQPLVWKNWYYRVRLGQIRVIFKEDIEWNIIEDIWYRWDIYKWL